MSGRSVFVDASGKRGKRLRLLASLLAAAAVILASIFAVSLIIEPVLPKVAGSIDPITGLKPKQTFIAARRATAVRAKLLASIARETRTAQRHRRAVVADQISGAYFAPWKPEGIDSFKSHARQLTDIFPVWLRLSPDGGSIDIRDWDKTLNPRRPELEEIARTNHVRLIPVIANAANSDFSGQNVAAMLADPQKSAVLQQALMKFVTENKYDGLQIDFENLDGKTLDQLAVWLGSLRRALSLADKSLSATVQTDWAPDKIRAIAANSDFVVGMVYDAHDDKGEPGPIAPAAFAQQALQSLTKSVGHSKLVMGFGVYGYDWTVGDSGAAVLSFSDAMALAARLQEGAVDFDAAALNPTFNYRDGAGAEHEVWFQDATTAANQLTQAKPFGIRGAAMWQLGSEDPSIWSIFGKSVRPDFARLKTIPILNAVQFSGDGELLTVAGEPAAGKRELEIDPKTGLIIDSSYLQFPSSYLITRQGAATGKIALTFDDGPDPEYTPQILAVLRKYHVPATFFVIGQNAETHPGLVRDMLRDGHEIGSHSYTHPNMGTVSQERAVLELNATQRALESITGRTIRLFRPPYNADAEPRSAEEVLPVVAANRLGYIVAGETIDPMDWYVDQPRADGSTHRLTATDIVDSVNTQLGDGNTILLHDSGGDRSATVDALEKLIPMLRAKGYTLVTMGELAGMPPIKTMPPMDRSQLALVGADKFTFYFAYGIQRIITVGFLLAIGLGLARILVITALAIANRKHRDLSDPAPSPTVDVIIAAYNEEKVIVATIQSILRSDYPNFAVVVVDDGSKDGTSAAVAAAFGHDPRVQLLHKENGGKASALNLALAHSQADIIVGVDADTQMDPGAIRLLVRHFADARIGAVAGNVKVGNRVNMLTRWQSLEYITSQNLDRVAYEFLSCITVVPGAIGAWRRTAVQAVGSYQPDTLAEDMDLTWRLQRGGWRIANETRAIAYTEAPEKFGALFKQRFRWTFGTLQCLWKHRSATFSQGALGWFALPSLWLFQIGAQILAPFVDLQLLVAGAGHLAAKLIGGGQSDLGSVGLSHDAWMRLLGVWLAFLAVEWLAGFYACRRDHEDPRSLLLLPLQRFAYRQIMYIALWKAIGRALGGIGQGWGKLDRKASVILKPATAPQRALERV